MLPSGGGSLTAARTRSPLAGWRGPLLALLVCAAGLSLEQWSHYDPHIRYDRFQLPAFDAYVYVAMAERPAVFSVAPWGYRLLAPVLADCLPGMSPVRGFYVLAWILLLGTGALLYRLLIRLGNGEWASLLGVSLFVFSGPVSEALAYPFVADPVCVFLLVAFLLALEAGASLGVLALLALLGAFAKEILLAVLPLLFVRAHVGASGLRAWRRGLLAALPALVVTIALRGFWTPYLGGESRSFPAVNVGHALDLIASSWRAWWWPALVGGLVPIAALGALRRAARPFLLRYGYLLLVYGALPFAAGVYVGTPERPRDFFSGDIPRLTLHLVPFLVPLVLVALDRLRAHRGPAPPLTRVPPWVERAAVAACVALVALPFVALDRYRRIDLSAQRDGLVVLATLRESFRAAERLDRGRPLIFTPEGYRWVPGKSAAPLMGQMRWFLREGFGPQPQYGVRDITLRSPEARVLVPCLTPRSLAITLALEAPTPETLAVALNDRPLGTALLGTSRTALVVHAPREIVFRGDNVLTLTRSGLARPGPRLLALEIRASGP
jgi:hypothetical protein